VKPIPICLAAVLCVAFTIPPLPPVKKVYRPATGVTKGAGAMALISRPAAVAVQPTWYFSATATAYGLTSGYATPFWITNRSGRAVVSWDASVPTNTVTNYTAWAGQKTNVYFRSLNVGTNLTATFVLAPTNFVLTITTVNATNLAFSRDFRSWTKIGATNYTATNGPYRPFWKAFGKTAAKPGAVYIKGAYQY
jgi:hypothetical protein